MNCKIFPLGDAALTIEFGNEISPEINNHILKIASHINKNQFEGFIEIVPAYSSVSVFYDVLKVRKTFPDFPTAFDAVKNILRETLQTVDNLTELKSRLIEIPICFDTEFAPDLESVASKNNLTRQKFIEIFTEKTYRVYMLGFLPGFAYMGEVDDRIAAPRRETPRLKVPKGSVGIAGKQTGIYSLESPGGWQIVGRTNVELFTPEAEIPTFFQAGDSVKFFEAKF
jgi:inhibitor of KinA